MILLRSICGLLLLLTLILSISVGLVGLVLRFASPRFRQRGEWLMATGAKVMLYFLVGAFLFALIFGPDEAQQGIYLYLMIVVVIVCHIIVRYKNKANGQSVASKHQTIDKEEQEEEK